MATELGNMRIWSVLGKTDPAHTQKFTRPGGFKGTAVKPMWANKQMTELFGPCGVGWGTSEPKFQLVTADEEILVYCTVGMWYFDNGLKEGLVYGIGGDKVLLKTQQGLRSDDEAFKKSYTDALSNAMKFIGVAADVHMGLFDDNKYVQSVRTEFDEAQKAEVFAEVERQKATHAPVAATVLEHQQAKATDIPPELDWRYQKSSGVLICRILAAKKTKKKDGSGELVTLQINREIDGKDKIFYFRATHSSELLASIGKVVKLTVVEAGKFTHVSGVLEIDGEKVETPAEPVLGVKPFGDPETQARFLASGLDLTEEELETLVNNKSWSAVLEGLKAEKRRLEAIEGASA
jgi:hypothetical protein